MKDLQRRLRELPRQVPPASDLWPAIEARLGSARTSGSRRREWLAPSVLAAAALLLAVVGAYSLFGGQAGRPAAPSPEPSGVVAPPLAGETAARTAQHFEIVLEPLRRGLDRRRGELSAETLRVVDEQLRIIDRALAEVRRALAADPQNLRAERFFGDLYLSKVRLLEQANRLPAGT